MRTEPFFCLDFFLKRSLGGGVSAATLCSAIRSCGLFTPCRASLQLQIRRGVVHYAENIAASKEVILKQHFDSLERRVIRSSIDWSGVGLALEQFLAGRFTYRSLEEWRERIRSGELLTASRGAEA